MKNFLKKIFEIHSPSKMWSSCVRRNNELSTFIVGLEKSLMASNFVWDIEYKPEGDYYVIRVKGE